MTATGEAKFTAKANTNLSNIDNTSNAAATALNTAGIRTVVETYSSGTDWYRVWSDGWCEQGGSLITGADATTTITLLKPYKDINYQIGYVGCGTNTNTSGASWINQLIYPNTNSTATARIINYKRSWKAEGYIS